MPYINTPILDSEKLKNQVAVVNAMNNPDLPNETANHWVQVVLRNATQFSIVPTGEHLVTGIFATKPTTVGSFTIGQFVAESSGAGATGGASFSIELDASGDSQPIAVGFEDPFWQTFKGGVVFSASAEAGYDAAESYGTPGITSGQYSGKTDKNVDVNVSFHASAIVEKHAIIVTVTQIQAQ